MRYKGTGETTPFHYHARPRPRQAMAALAGRAGGQGTRGGPASIPLLSMRLAAPSAGRRRWITTLGPVEGTGRRARSAPSPATPEVARLGRGTPRRSRCGSLALAKLVAHPAIRDRAHRRLPRARRPAATAVVLTLLDGSLDAAGPASGHARRSPRPSSSSARSSGVGPHDELAVLRALRRRWLPAAGIALAEMRPPPRRLRAVGATLALVDQGAYGQRRRGVPRRRTSPMSPDRVDQSGVARLDRRPRRHRRRVRATRAGRASTPPADRTHLVACSPGVWCSRLGEVGSVTEADRHTVRLS